jgi:CRISPR-associated protein Cmr3
MNQILLQPSDVLFFRDGRPMGGSLSGHGAAWPLPSVTNAALHAALHRAEIKEVHAHRRGRSGIYGEERDRKFGSLLTAGPFPVFENQWYFPRPLDAGVPGTPEASFFPLATDSDRKQSSLPKPLRHPVANSKAPCKEPVAPWWNREAWSAYLGTGGGSPDFKNDADFSDTESTYGIGIDAETSTQDGERFYSAHYLRLREGCRMGLLATAEDKVGNDRDNRRDLLHSLFPNSPNSGSRTPVIVGGQQRVCSAVRDEITVCPMPMGKTDGFAENGVKCLVKWVLLSPAIFPKIEARTNTAGNPIHSHPGGWLPNWVSPDSGEVLLKTGDTERRGGEFREAWRTRVRSEPPVHATLVAAVTGKPLPVTGYALDNGLEDRAPGPKPTHLAVPAGAVYYFEADTKADARALAAALNWHGAYPGTEVKNRRSTLMGEKGFGLGVCGTWTYHDGNRPN